MALVVLAAGQWWRRTYSAAAAPEVNVFAAFVMLKSHTDLRRAPGAHTVHEMRGAQAARVGQHGGAIMGGSGSGGAQGTRDTALFDRRTPALTCLFICRVACAVCPPPGTCRAVASTPS